MHRAPAVSFSVGRSRWHLGCVALFGCLALVVTVVFLNNQAQLDWRSAVLVVAAIASSALAVQGWRHSPTGQLRWNGQHWYWAGYGADQDGRLSLLLDFQVVMLVAITAEKQRPQWIWLEAGCSDVHWVPLRRAIVSSRSGSESGAKTRLKDRGDLA